MASQSNFSAMVTDLADASTDGMLHGNLILPVTSGERIALQLDPTEMGGSAHQRLQEGFRHPSAQSSPSPTFDSPETPVEHRPHSAHGTSDTRMPERPAPTLHHTRSSTSLLGKVEREKRKRSRVTPDQLVHLERFFAADRSPTAARRREISELLGMHERQTQIWFQNRRAKAKMQDGKQKSQGSRTDTPPDTPPELSTGFEIELQNLIHEDEPVTIIPCTDLSIGTWRRIASSSGKHDLVAYVCETKRCLTWFIHSEGYGFKMEISFDIILETQFSNAAPGSGLASFFLSRPPVFYLETAPERRPDGVAVRHWKRCVDWTEDQQATKVLRHDLIGSAIQLAHFLRNLNATKAGFNQVRPPHYSPQSSQRPAMALPQPPLSTLRGPGFDPQREAELQQQQGDEDPAHRRSISGPPPPESPYSHHHATSSPATLAPPGAFAQCLPPTIPLTLYSQEAPHPHSHPAPHPHSHPPLPVAPSPTHYESALFPTFSAQKPHTNSDAAPVMHSHSAAMQAYTVPEQNNRSFSTEMQQHPQHHTHHRHSEMFLGETKALPYPAVAARRPSSSDSHMSATHTPPPTLLNHVRYNQQQCHVQASVHVPPSSGAAGHMMSGLSAVAFESDGRSYRGEVG